ncbi:putative ribonuclease H-like domain-containing protein [Tanacetum coccineum]
MYCLVVTDDYSRFIWVFFLATKDETSGILKSFITGIENLVDHKVKVIRCDNRTKFKNREMNQFCEMKGILRQFSIARTPHQIGVGERKNRTLIKAARPMLADSKLPTTFWAEAINTACYVQNRVLVVKPHNKTPYELVHDRTPTLSFMRPFGCPNTILNTINHLGKFDGKADEGFFVGYSLNSKAFRVFKGRIRIVEENLHISFSESTHNVVGTKASDNASQARKEIEHVKDYILLPLWTADAPYSQDPKSSHDDGSKPLSDGGKKVDEDPRKESECNDQEKEDNVNSTNNVNTASTNKVNAVGGKTSIKLPFDPSMPALEDDSIFDFSRDDEDDGAVADMNNLDTTIQVSPNPTTRIHKDHPLDQVIEDLQSAIQTRKILKNLEEQFYVDGIIFGSTKNELCFAFEKLSTWRKILDEFLWENLLSSWVYKWKQKKDGIFISQDKYVEEILKRFGFTEVKTASTPTETQKPLLKDEDGAEVDVHIYQVNLKVSHLHAVKRIFSDYARVSLDRKFTTGGCQFLRCRLISWQCKKQTVVANSTTEAEYVAASSCYGQVLWIQNQLLDYGYRQAKKSVKLMMEKLFRMELKLMLVT